MMKRVIIFITFFCLIAPAGAEVFRVPGRLPVEKAVMHAMARSDGKVRWESRIENIVKGDQWILREEGKGIRSPFDFQTSWRIESVYTAQGGFLRPDWMRKETFRPDGSLIRVETKSYDLLKNMVRFTRSDEKGRAQLDKTFSMAEDTIGNEALGVPLRSLPFESGKDYLFHLFTAEPRLYKITAVNRGREHLKIPAGAFDATKIELVPDLGVLGLLNAFIPKTYMWQAVAPPHIWLKYQGLESGLNTPEVVIELAHITRE